MSKETRSTNDSKAPVKTTVGRRSVIKAGAGVAAAALAAPHISVAQDATPGASPAASPVVGADGFYPSGVAGVNDAYTRMPALFKATDGVPGNGDKVVAMIMIYGTPASGKDGNQYWQGLDEQLGVSWEPIQVPNSSYGERRRQSSPPAICRTCSTSTSTRR